MNLNVCIGGANGIGKETALRCAKHGYVKTSNVEHTWNGRCR
jgi:NAD(P)-dependent dehydrogenase (short-subunit alcohol dehydrogenase family)